MASVFCLTSSGTNRGATKDARVYAVHRGASSSSTKGEIQIGTRHGACFICTETGLGRCF